MELRERQPWQALARLRERLLGGLSHAVGHAREHEPGYALQEPVVDPSVTIWPGHFVLLRMLGLIAGLRRDGQQTLIELTGGMTVPVGRTYLAAVRSDLEARGA